jgi:hypothetical protein
LVSLYWYTVMHVQQNVKCVSKVYIISAWAVQ